MIDWANLRPFEILWFSYEFDGDPDSQLKFFVVARNVAAMRIIACFKPTSQTRYYDAEPLRLAGVVEYRAGEIDGFPAQRTIIDPEKVYPVSYDHLRRCEAEGQFRQFGIMPVDFRERMIAAVQNKKEWRNKQKADFLAWF